MTTLLMLSERQWNICSLDVMQTLTDEEKFAYLKLPKIIYQE